MPQSGQFIGTLSCRLKGWKWLLYPVLERVEYMRGNEKKAALLYDHFTTRRRQGNRCEELLDRFQLGWPIWTVNAAYNFAHCVVHNLLAECGENNGFESSKADSIEKLALSWRKLGCEGLSKGTAHIILRKFWGFSTKPRILRNSQDSLAGGKSFELAVPFDLCKRDCDRAAQRNPAQHPRSRLRAGQTRGTYAH